MAIKRRVESKNNKNELANHRKTNKNRNLTTETNVSGASKKSICANVKICGIECKDLCLKIMHPIETVKSLNKNYKNQRKYIFCGAFIFVILPVLLFFNPVESWRSASTLSIITKYIKDTYGSDHSKIIPLYKTRSMLNKGKDNHKLYKLGQPNKQLVDAQNRQNTKNHIIYLKNKIFNNYNLQNFKEKYLEPLLIERVSGTKGAEDALKHIISSLPDFYDIQIDKSQQLTGLGDERLFQNIIASSNKYAERQLVVACHYDSKYWPKENEIFIAATDSAVPCAMMIQTAWNLNKEVKKAGNLGLQLIFFDGEEAFINWTDKDSVYGSKNLVSKWKEIEKTQQNRKINNKSEKIRKIDRINCFILLDLIGNEQPYFNHDRKFSKANDLFKRLGELEQHNTLMKQFYKLKNKSRYYFNTNRIGQRFLGIDDDHMPWYRNGVENILHLIPTPFPYTWHTVEDHGGNLDYESIWNLQHIVDIFVIEYLGLFEFTNE